MQEDEATSPPTESPALAIDPDAEFAWDTHPARERPGAAVLAILVILLLSILVYHLAGHLIVGVIAAAVLCLTLQRFFFASRYMLDADGMTLETLMGQRHLRWDEVRLFQFGEGAAWISPLRRRTWREARRGIHVLFAGRRGEILAQIRARLPAEIAGEIES